MTAAVRGQTPCPQGSLVASGAGLTGRYHTEEVCFGIEIVPAKVPGGPIG